MQSGYSGKSQLWPETGNPMEHADFQIGMEFRTVTGHWRVTDIGTRTVIAIKLDQDDPRNYNGPPYSILENVFDEYDLEGCEPLMLSD